MNITMKCLGCAKTIHVPETTLNQKLQCRYCGVIFMLTSEAPGWPVTPRLISAAQAWGNAANETAILPSVRADAVMVDSDSDRFTSAKPSSSRKIAPFRTAKFAPIGAKTGGYRKIKSSAQMTVIPNNDQAEADGFMKFGSLCVVLTASIFASLFFFSGSPVKAAKAEKIVRVEAPVVPVVYQAREVIEVAPVAPAVKKVEAPKVVKHAPIALTPVEAVAEPVVEIVEVWDNTPVKPVMPKGGAFESLNKAMGDIPTALILPTKVEQAESLSSKGAHDKAAKLYQEAADEAEKAGRSEEAQLFSLKSIEETRQAQNEIPRLNKRWKF